MNDPFDGVNMITSTDDGFANAFVSPLVLEIDVSAPVSGVVGDDNANLAVDAADYVLWRNGLGTTYTPADYNVWRAHFGRTADSGAALPSTEPLSTAAPEPASLVLFLIGMLMMFSRRSAAVP
jgi:hypothetical protein